MPGEAEVLKLQQAYSKTFKAEEGMIVLEDLAKICFKNHTTINEVSNIMAFNEGQRMVFLHIERAMKMNLKSLRKDLPNE